MEMYKIKEKIAPVYKPFPRYENEHNLRNQWVWQTSNVRIAGYNTGKVVFNFLFMHFCPGTMTTHADSINSDLQRGVERRLRHTQH